MISYFAGQFFCLKRIIFTVTNDLSYDQRMHRICTTLAGVGFDVTLTGRKMRHSIPLQPQPYTQKRLSCFFRKGFLFYALYNVQLFVWLLFRKTDIICAIDLDTILPCYVVSVLRNKRRVYDAHEYFTELKEVVTRPFVHRFWSAIERFSIPRFPKGYTVSESIASAFFEKYHVRYLVIRNVPVKFPYAQRASKGKYILYQGAVNEARGLENLVAAMQFVDACLYIYGEGNISGKIARLVEELRAAEKVQIRGPLAPDALRTITAEAYIGVNLVEPVGLNQYYSLANKFFDYMHAGVPQLTMNFPEYRRVNDEFEVAVLADTVGVEEIASKLNLLLHDDVLYQRLRHNCLVARERFNWQEEEKKLLQFYNMDLSAGTRT